MTNKLGMSTGKGFAKGIYDEYAKTAGRLITNVDTYNSSGVERVELDEAQCGIYAIYLYDSVNKNYISQIVYIANISRDCNISIKGGTLSYHHEIDNAKPYFEAISTDLQYKFKIISVTKIATITTV